MRLNDLGIEFIQYLLLILGVLAERKDKILNSGARSDEAGEEKG